MIFTYLLVSNHNSLKACTHRRIGPAQTNINHHPNKERLGSLLIDIKIYGGKFSLVQINLQSIQIK